MGLGVRIKQATVVGLTGATLGLWLWGAPGPGAGPISPLQWVLVGLSALANIFVLGYHHLVPAHPKFLILPWRRSILLLHIVSGTLEFGLGIATALLGGHEVLGRLMALVAVALHVPSALAQAQWVFGSRAVMRPAYLMCIALHAYTGVMLWFNPSSLGWTVATFLLFNTYVWVRIYYFVLDKLGIFGDSKYTVAVLAAGMTTTPAVLGTEAMLAVAVGLGVYISAHIAFFVRSDAELREFCRERARDSALSPGLRATWQRRPGCEGEDRELARGLFRALDRDGDGVVTPDEVAEVLANASLPTAAIVAFMRRQPAGGAMPFDRFLADLWPIPELREVAREVIFTHGGPKAERDRALFVFDLLDINGDGTIDRSELQALLDEWAMPPAEARRWTRTLGLADDAPIPFPLFFERMRPIWRFIYYDVIEPKYGRREDLLERVSHQRRDAQESLAVEMSLRTANLRLLPFLADAEPAFLHQLAQALVPLEREAGARIFAEGERGEEFFLIAKGQVQISRDDQTVALLGAGACFGEGALLHGRARSATATARLDCQLLRASGASFHYLLDRFPSMRAAIERIDTARQDGGPLRTGS
jgi:Ca2+-binding EF-hand superfamily protein